MRYARLTRAQGRALAGDFEGAYRILIDLIRMYPADVEVHRLHGNTLELDALTHGAEGPMDWRLRAARHHYREILRIAPSNAVAFFDMGEHFANLSKIGIASVLFAKALALSESASVVSGSDAAALDEDDRASARAWLEEHA